MQTFLVPVRTTWWKSCQRQEKVENHLTISNDLFLWLREKRLHGLLIKIKKLFRSSSVLYCNCTSGFYCKGLVFQTEGMLQHYLH